MTSVPIVLIQKGRDRRLLQGHPWIYSNEVLMDSESKSLASGAIVHMHKQMADGSQGPYLGTAMFNPHSLICGRMLCRDPHQSIDQAFLEKKLQSALNLRHQLFDAPYYRLIHAEADGLPGLVIDRFADTLSVQVNTAGIERLLDPLVQALNVVIAPKNIILRADSPVRVLEGLELYTKILQGSASVVDVHENGAIFSAHLVEGQKTGWFYDHRVNRACVARLAAGKRVLDCYAYSGGFGIQAALGGAQEVVFLDRSEDATAIARHHAEKNNVHDRCHVVRADAFEHMEMLSRQDELFDIVVVDPPAFVKSRKHMKSGLKGYIKMTRLASQLVKPSGFLAVASCSHNISETDFKDAVAQGIHEGGRTGKVILFQGAGPDHPVHPHLPETHYLKFILIALD